MWDIDYDFKYRLRVSFNTPDDVMKLIHFLNIYSEKCEEDNGFHPALVQVGETDYLCFVENDGVIFNKKDDVELHTCGYEDDMDILDDVIKKIKNDIPGVSIDGYYTVIYEARDIAFVFYKNGIQIDTLSDDNIAEMYEKDLGILGTMEE